LTKKNKCVRRDSTKHFKEGNMAVYIFLKRLSIKNFKGIKNLEINFSPATLIVGENATGKTSIYDAWLWLLFNKDSQGQTNFEVKPVGGSGEVEVEAEVKINEKLYKFKKVLRENWTKKRGESEKKLTGHTASHFINNIPKKQKEYQETINNILPEKLFKTILSPLYFNEGLKWQQRRSMLFDLVEIASDLELAKKDPAFAGLVEPLGQYSPEDYKKVLTSQKRRLNDELKTIPARIDELNKLILDEKLPSKEKLNQDIKEIQEALNKAKYEPNRGNLDKLNTQLAGVEEEEMRKVLEVNALRNKNEALTKYIEEARASMEERKVRVKQLQEEITYLKNKWKHIRNAKPDQEVSICPVCKQKLPNDMLKDALAKFNKRKVSELQSISEQGKIKKSQIEQMEKELEKLELNIMQWDKQKLEIWEQIKKIEQERTELEKIKKKIENQIQKERVKIEKQTDDAKIQELEKKLEDLQKQKLQLEQQEQIQKNIDKLLKKEREVASQLAEVEEQLTLLEKFQLYKISLIEDTINSKFQLCKWKLFNVLINGSVEETCECMVDGVPYRNLNTGNKINAGLDISQTFAKHLQVEIPVWIDNAESVTDWKIKPDSQLIFLKAEEGKQLTIKQKQ